MVTAKFSSITELEVRFRHNLNNTTHLAISNTECFWWAWKNAALK